MWVEFPAGRGPFAIAVSARVVDKIDESKSPLVVLASTELLGTRNGVVRLGLPTLWSKTFLKHLKLDFDGPEVWVAKSGVKASAASLVLGVAGSERGKLDVKVSFRLDRLLRVGSRWLRRAMPLLGLGVHLRFLYRDVQDAWAATREPTTTWHTTLCWFRVAGDVAAIPYPPVGVVTETLVWLGNVAAQRGRAEP